MFQPKWVKYFYSIFCITLLLFVSFSFNSLAYAADDQKEVRKKAVYDAEVKFADAINKAKQDYKKVTSDPNASESKKMQANAIKNKAIADAKEVRDKTIADAQKAFAIAVSPSKDNKLQKSSEKQPFCFLWWCW